MSASHSFRYPLRVGLIALLPAAIALLLILSGCDSPVSADTGGGDPLESPEETAPEDSPTASTPGTYAVAWEPADADGTWKGWTELESDGDTLTGSIELTTGGITRFHVYSFNAAGELSSVGYVRDEVTDEGDPVTHQFAMDESTLTPVSLRSGSVQGRTLDLTRYANAIAGVGEQPGTADGTFQEARFSTPAGITTDGRYLYITDSANHTIRRMELATGQVITLAGVAGASGLVNGTEGKDARFDRPRGITYHDGVLYVADGQRDSGPGTRVRTVDPETGATTTLIDTDSQIIEAIDVSVLDGYLYVTDFFGNSVHRYNLSNGGLEVFAGEASNNGDGGTGGGPGVDGTGTTARFVNPWGIVSDGSYLYVADTNDNAVRRIDPTSAEVTTIIETDTSPYLQNPAGITTDGERLYVSDQGDNRIREIILDESREFESIDDVAGKEGESGTTWGTGDGARFGQPIGITTDGFNLYVADRRTHLIRKIQ